MDFDTILKTLQDVQGQRGSLTINWAEFGAVITAIGALGMAAFGVAEALGKALTVVYTSRRTDGHPVTIRWGLPYVGFGVVRRMTDPLRPALSRAYGKDYVEIIAQHYRADRGKGRAPDVIREGVKLGLPFLSLDAAAKVIAAVWDMEKKHAEALARALTRDASEEDDDEADRAAERLAGRFATALDERVNSAFMLAEARYEAQAKMWAAIAAVLLAVIFNLSLDPRYPWWVAALIGLVAVPLAPIAKDLAASLQGALTAFKSIPSKRA